MNLNKIETKILIFIAHSCTCNINENHGEKFSYEGRTPWCEHGQK